MHNSFFTSKFHKFRNNFLPSHDGNVAIITAFVLVPLMLLSGGAIDLIRFLNIKTEIQGAVDSAVLASAQFSNDRDVNEVIAEYLAANIDPNLVDPDEIVTSFSEARDAESREVIINASYDMPTQFLSIAGLDTIPVNISTQGIQDFQSLEISLVLDISASMRTAGRIDLLRPAAENFVDLVLRDEVRSITSINLIPFAGSVNMGNDFTHILTTRPDEIDINNDANHADGHFYSGCFELDESNFNDMDFQTRRQIVPNFFRYHISTSPGYRWCPPSSSEAVFLSNNKTVLTNRINHMELGDGTGMDIGAAVGLKSLSPALRGALKGNFTGLRPTNYNTDTLKVLVLMTDGRITPQFRPRNGCVNATGSACRTVKTSRMDAENNFADICQQAKDNNIIVYTIGFQIESGSTPDQLLRACPQSASQYYFIEGTNLAAAFEGIAANINGLRVQ